MSSADDNIQNISVIPSVPPAGTIVSDLHTHDILCGRGSGPNDHIGNIQFRDVISTRRQNYLTTSSRAEKARIAIQILNEVRSKNPPGRFLERMTRKGNRKSHPMWMVVDEDKAMEKIKQALRQIRSREKSPPKTNSNTSENANTNVNVNVNNFHSYSNNLNVLYSNPNPNPNFQNTNQVTSPSTPSISPHNPTNYLHPNNISTNISTNININTNANPTTNNDKNNLNNTPTPAVMSMSPMSNMQQTNLNHHSNNNTLTSPVTSLTSTPVITSSTPVINVASNKILSSHQQQAQQQFFKSMGHDEAAISSIQNSEDFEPQPLHSKYTNNNHNNYNNQSSSDNMSLLEGITSSTADRLISVLERESHNSIQAMSLSEIEIDHHQDDNPNPHNNHMNLNDADINGNDMAEFPPPNMNANVNNSYMNQYNNNNNQINYNNNNHSRSSYLLKYMGQSQSQSDQSMMSMEFLTSSMGDMSFGDLSSSITSDVTSSFTSSSDNNNNSNNYDNRNLSQAQRHALFTQMSQSGSSDTTLSVDPRNLSEMLRDFHQDSLRDIGPLLKSLNSDEQD